MNKLLIEKRQCERRQSDRRVGDRRSFIQERDKVIASFLNKKNLTNDELKHVMDLLLL
ncbi:MAG: hypothetical protein HQK70_09325 [Desulfamplus sp.]|nr:hypothetical protein [Desulfamplus sp.]